MTSIMPAARLPWTVRAAAVILALYGVAVLLNATVDQTALGWGNIEARGFPRAVIRFLGMSLTAWGLLKGARWAWWCGVLLPGFFLVAGLVGIGFVFRFRAEAPEVWSAVATPLLFASFTALATAVVFLLLPSSRAAFRRPAA